MVCREHRGDTQSFLEVLRAIAVSHFSGVLCVLFREQKSMSERRAGRARDLAIDCEH